MPYKYDKLLGRIVEKCGTQAMFAEKMNLSERSVSLKLNGKRPWNQLEIARACDVLGIPMTEIDCYFLLLKFNNIELAKTKARWLAERKGESMKQFFKENWISIAVSVATTILVRILLHW